MKLKLTLLHGVGGFLLTSMLTYAAPVLVIGTPGNSQLATPTGPSPTLGHLLNFDGLVPFSTFAPSTFLSQGILSISSPDGLLVEPFSTQSFPNELFDNSANGTANISIGLAFGTSAIGIGIADSDPVSITLQALAANGAALGSVFNINLATTESAINTGNGYYVLEDTSADIFGLKITQSVGSATNSGLAIDDLQTVPEPSTSLLLMLGVATLGAFRSRGRAQSKRA